MKAVAVWMLSLALLPFVVAAEPSRPRSIHLIDHNGRQTNAPPAHRQYRVSIAYDLNRLPLRFD
jgi:hypothetical protein